MWMVKTGEGSVIRRRSTGNRDAMGATWSADGGATCVPSMPPRRGNARGQADSRRRNMRSNAGRTFFTKASMRSASATMPGVLPNF